MVLCVTKTLFKIHFWDTLKRQIHFIEIFDFIKIFDTSKVFALIVQTITWFLGARNAESRNMTFSAEISNSCKENWI